MSREESEAPELIRDGEGLALRGKGLLLRPDLRAMLPRLGKENLSRELLVRAAKLRGTERPFLFDATAGLGEDSLLLAAAGFSVLLCERNPVIAALLRDSLERARSDAALAPIVARMELAEGDSLLLLPTLERRPDVIYLDPMFPARTKSALIGKKLQLIQGLEAPCGDEDELLRAAFEARPKKVIVKRMRKGPYLAGEKPDYSVAGKAVRYDVFVRQGACPAAE